MDLKVKVVAKTFETQGDNIDTHDLFVLGGKMAGVCYMPEDYFDGKIQNREKAISKANFTCNSGHHSVFDHGSLTFQISGLPKIMAMLLNSTEQYTTSEKSARYTIMHPETELETEIYEKWQKIFNKRIAEVYPDIDEKTRSKLSLENARYMISVFTPTHMMWTTTYRQIAYVIEWLDKLAEDCSNLPGEFNRKIAEWCRILSNAFMKCTDSQEHIIDNKGRKLEFLTYQSTGNHINDVEELGEVYQITYLASFAQLAQLHRHRTIHYEFDFNGDSALQYGVFVPPIIKDTEFETEWKADFEKVAYCYPQGTLVKVLEEGRASKFFEKCKERLCGRAQLEVMMNTKNTMEKFINTDKSKFQPKTLAEMDNVAPNGHVVTKCAMKCVECKETCFWKAAKGLDRLI